MPPVSTLMFALSTFIAISIGIPQGSLDAPEKTSKVLTVERVYGREFGASRGSLNGEWLPDGRRMATFSSSAKVPGGIDIVVIDVETKAKETLVSATELIPKGEKAPIDIESFEISSDLSKILIFTNSKKVWRQNTRGDYWLYDSGKKILKKVGNSAPTSSLMFAKLSPNAKNIGFVQGHNIYVQNIASSKVKKLTQDGTETIINGTFDWVYEEELSCRDGWRWSPDGKSIAFWQLDSSREPLYTMINNTDTKYPATFNFPYPMAGGINASSRIGVVSASGGKTKWMDVAATSDTGYIARMDWAANSSELIIQKLNRLQNFADFRIANVKTGRSKSVLQDRDSAYIESGTNNASKNGVLWIEDGERFVTISEKDGWRHIYSVSRSGADVKVVTPGEFDIDTIVGVDEKRNFIYYLASPKIHYQRYLYRSTLKGNPEVKRITPETNSGTNEYNISPTGAFAIVNHSQFGVPGDTDLISLPTHQVVRSLGNNASLRAKLRAENLGETRVIQLKAANGESMDASLILPPSMDSSKKYPVIFYVYGESWGTTVNDAWEGPHYLFHQMLAQRGYIIASIDGRGTPSLKGRDWRKSIYKKIGIVSSADQASGLKELCQLPFVDSTRIGIWGWSSGGNMTLHMMLRYPDLYHAGIAIAASPDELLYDTIYQERYMGLPADNKESYEESSVMNLAKNLKGSLLLVHGTGDDNVHYQPIEMLMNKLIEYGKQFQVMPYPNRTHEINEGPGTTLHLRHLMENFFLKNLPAGSR
jgi:dipeptidyl-peptidase-4